MKKKSSLPLFHIKIVAGPRSTSQNPRGNKLIKELDMPSKTYSLNKNNYSLIKQSSRPKKAQNR